MGIAAQVEVVRPRLGAGGHQVGAVELVGPGGGQHGPRPGDHRPQRRFRVETIARTGLRLSLAAVVALAILAVAGVPPLWLAVPILLAVGSLGLVFGNTTALALAAVPAAAGLGSAILGMLQHVLADAVAPVVSIGGGTTALPLALTMLVTSVGANAALAATTRAGRSPRSTAAAGRTPEAG